MIKVARSRLKTLNVLHSKPGYAILETGTIFKYARENVSVTADVARICPRR